MATADIRQISNKLSKNSFILVNEGVTRWVVSNKSKSNPNLYILELQSRIVDIRFKVSEFVLKMKIFDVAQTKQYIFES